MIYAITKPNFVTFTLTGSSEATDTLYTLALLKEIIGVFPQHSTKAICETLLRLMTLSNPVSVYRH